MNLNLKDRAPRFVSDSSEGPLKLTDYIGKWVVLFSYPENFTPVSTTEIVSFSRYQEKFKEKNCELIGISPDSTSSHIAYIQDIEKNTGSRINFPLISDTDGIVKDLYDMKNNRCTYFIDPSQKIRCVLVYPYENGRNIGEILRILDSLQETDKSQVNTPANWSYNLATIEPSSRGYIDLMDNIKKNNFMNWYIDRSW